MNPNSIGESVISPQMQQQVAPDVVSPQGQQQLSQHLGIAKQQKELLDFIFKGIADKVGAEYSSRIKNPQTVVQKIAQKRIQGRDYNIKDINDAYGSRIIVKSDKQIPEIKKMVEKAESLGVIKINKSEMVDTDYHKSWHVDFETKQGTHGELQILTGKEEANSVINHDLRSIHGEKMPSTVKQLADKQASIAKSLPHDKAHQLAQIISEVHKSTNDQPMSPQVNASLLASIKQSQ